MLHRYYAPASDAAAYASAPAPEGEGDAASALAAEEAYVAADAAVTAPADDPHFAAATCPEPTYHTTHGLVHLCHNQTNTKTEASKSRRQSKTKIANKQRLQTNRFTKK